MDGDAMRGIVARVLVLVLILAVAILAGKAGGVVLGVLTGGSLLVMVRELMEGTWERM